MHKLDRSIVCPPACLGSWSNPPNSWGDFGTTGFACKRAVRAELINMQGIPVVTAASGSFQYGLRCAYCESPIRHEGHIEHFRRKRHFPSLTFTWDNLFLSCESKEHCGHFKDRTNGAPYNPSNLIKPDIEDPEALLYFHSTGSVTPRNNGVGLTANDYMRASETIRVFNLDCRTLQGERAKALKLYRDKNPGILEFLMDECSPDESIAFIQAEIEATRWEPYATTIKHFFEKAA